LGGTDNYRISIKKSPEFSEIRGEFHYLGFADAMVEK
jgi:hypothetical protein